MGVQNIKGLGLEWLELLIRNEGKVWQTTPAAIAQQKTSQKNPFIKSPTFSLFSRFGSSLIAPIMEAYKTEVINRIYKKLGKGKLSPSEARQAIKSHY